MREAVGTFQDSAGPACESDTLAGVRGAGRHDDRLAPSAWMLYRLARWARRRSVLHTSVDLPRTTDVAKYRTWRRLELERQLHDHFDVARVAGRVVLDFGCGTGELCAVLARHQPGRLIGMDKSVEATARAVSNAIQKDALRGCAIEFICNDDQDRLPLDDASVDLICCFDVLEHIPDVACVLGEWRRILRRCGRVWIWWSPWRGPYGHHLESLMPLPWVHLICGERSLFAACARLYDDPAFVPRWWDRDPATGLKTHNKWQTTESFHPFLNRLTRPTFDRLACSAGFSVSRRETHGFSGSWPRRATRTLLPVPWLGECFVSFYVYELRPA
jgi:SAM-dependent methyltransferase